MYVLSKLWYIAQTLPATKLITQRIEKFIGYFIWKNSIYRTSREQLRLRAPLGGLGLTDVHRKGLALITRSILLAQTAKGHPFDHAFWRANERPLGMVYPRNHCLHAFEPALQLIASLPPNDVREGRYDTTAALYTECKPQSNFVPHIEQKYPTRNWRKIWAFLRHRKAPLQWKADCYLILNELVPTGEKRRRHGIALSANCRRCGNIDTLMHRLTTCNGAGVLWRWTQNQIKDRTGRSSLNVRDLRTLDIRIYDKSLFAQAMWLAMGTLSWIYRHYETDIRAEDFRTTMEAAYNREYPRNEQ